MAKSQLKFTNEEKQEIENALSIAKDNIEYRKLLILKLRAIDKMRLFAQPRG